MAIASQPICSLLFVIIPQQVDREEQEPEPPLLVLPELELVLLPELLLVLELPPPSTVTLHWLAQFEVSQDPTFVEAVWQSEFISSATQDEELAAVSL